MQNESTDGSELALDDDEIWHLRAPSERHVGLNVEKAWKLTEGVSDIRVVLCDFGVDYEHPALAQVDRDLAIDFDHTLDGKGVLLSRGGRILDKFEAHGTACAGLVCGIDEASRVTDVPDGMRFVGVAPKCKLVPVRISTNFEEKSLLAALDYAAKNGEVLLLPRFLPRSDKLDEALNRIAASMPVVCAAGNESLAAMTYPAYLDLVIAVGACNDRGYRSTYSNIGGRKVDGGKPSRGPDVVAPSNDVPVENRTIVRLDRDEARLHAEELRLRAEELNLRAEELSQRLNRKLSGEKIGEARRQLNGAPAPDVKSLMRLGILKSEATRSAPNGQDVLDLLSRERGWNLDKFGERSIATTDNMGKAGYNTDPAGDYCKVAGDFGFGGTSAASSLVAGVVALMLSMNPALKGKPKVLRDLLKQASSLEHLRLQSGSNDMPAGKDPDRAKNEFGAGLVDAWRAVELSRMYAESGKSPDDRVGRPTDLRASPTAA